MIDNPLNDNDNRIVPVDVVLLVLRLALVALPHDAINVRLGKAPVPLSKNPQIVLYL